MALSGLLLVARLVLAGVFAVAGFAKLRDRSGTEQSVIAFGVPTALGRPVAVLMPLAELVCTVALVPVRTAWWGAVGVLALLLLFTVAISVSLTRGRAPDCHCFGQLSSKPIGWTTLVRNGALLAVAFFLVAQGDGQVGASVSDWPRLAAAEGVVAGLLITLVAVAAFELVMLFSLLRQNGRLLLRLEAVEARLGSNPGVPVPNGLPVGSEAPAFTLTDLDGHDVSLGTLVGQGRALLLVFLEPGCGACDGLMPDLSLWQRTHAERLLVVPVSRGNAQVNRAKASRHGLQHLLLQSDREVASSYRVTASPSAVLVRDGLIASDISAGADAIRGLVLWATAPEPLKRGARIPSLGLAEINGGTVDLSTLRGRRTLLLFWNPACGFCQRMLDDLKAWETSRTSAAPDLVVVSTGTVQANRSQGLRSRVVLDSQSAVAQLLGSGGTPSAVMLDEQGRVASDIGVGAAAVLALANSATASEEIPA